MFVLSDSYLISPYILKDKKKNAIIDLLWMAFIAQQQLGYLYGPRSPNLLETSAILNACIVN